MDVLICSLHGHVDPIFLIPLLPVVLLIIIARYWFGHSRIGSPLDEEATTPFAQTWNGRRRR